ncbi:MAG: hypothetical protein ABI237_13115 [Ginsengibacter sp.]
MKSILYKLFAVLVILYLSGCVKRHFYPDKDDPGLSRLTSHGFNIATAYINKVPYINPFKNTLFGVSNYTPTLSKMITNSAYDTLSLSWPIEINDSTVNYNQPYRNITLKLPIPKTFTQQDLLAMSGQRMSQKTNTIVMQSYYNQPNELSGPSNIYLVTIKEDPSYTPAHLILSGLFEGNIGDSILITKGRFDFEISTDKINF